jgi:hypothetical protein
LVPKGDSNVRVARNIPLQKQDGIVLGGRPREALRHRDDGSFGGRQLPETLTRELNEHELMEEEVRQTTSGGPPSSRC